MKKLIELKKEAPFSLETKRLRLRELTLQDLDALAEILSDKETMQFYPAPFNRRSTERWIANNLDSYRRQGMGLWALVLKDNGTFLGQCGITWQNINNQTVPEIGYHINKKYWNNGYATEAAAACLAHGFSKLQFPEIYIHTYVKNIPSQRIAEKIGMDRLHEYDKYIPSHGIVWRHVVYSKKKAWLMPDGIKNTLE